MRVAVDLGGPLFDGTARRVIAEATEQAAFDVAVEGGDMMRASTTVFRHPTGFYRSRIGFRPTAGGFIIDDGGVIYGLWLEGVSRRNRTSRFKGYRIWRQTRQRLQAVARDIAQATVRRHLGRLR